MIAPQTERRIRTTKTQVPGNPRFSHVPKERFVPRIMQWDDHAVEPEFVTPREAEDLVMHELEHGKVPLEYTVGECYPVTIRHNDREYSAQYRYIDNDTFEIVERTDAGLHWPETVQLAISSESDDGEEATTTLMRSREPGNEDDTRDGSSDNDMETDDIPSVGPAALHMAGEGVFEETQRPAAVEGVATVATQADVTSEPPNFPRVERRQLTPEERELVRAVQDGIRAVVEQQTPLNKPFQITLATPDGRTTTAYYIYDALAGFRFLADHEHSTEIAWPKRVSHPPLPRGEVREHSYDLPPEALGISQPQIDETHERVQHEVEALDHIKHAQAPRAGTFAREKRRREQEQAVRDAAERMNESLERAHRAHIVMERHRAEDADANAQLEEQFAEQPTDKVQARAEEDYRRSELPQDTAEMQRIVRTVEKEQRAFEASVAAQQKQKAVYNALLQKRSEMESEMSRTSPLFSPLRYLGLRNDLQRLNTRIARHETTYPYVLRAVAGTEAPEVVPIAPKPQYTLAELKEQQRRDIMERAAPRGVVEYVTKIDTIQRMLQETVVGGMKQIGTTERVRSTVADIRILRERFQNMIDHYRGVTPTNDRAGEELENFLERTEYVLDVMENLETLCDRNALMRALNQEPILENLRKLEIGKKAMERALEQHPNFKTDIRM